MWLDLKGLAMSHTPSSPSLAPLVPVLIPIHSILCVASIFLSYFTFMFGFGWFVFFLPFSNFFVVVRAKPHRDLEMRKFWISCIHLKRMLRSSTCLRVLFVHTLYTYLDVCLSFLCVRVLYAQWITSFDLFIPIRSRASASAIESALLIEAPGARRVTRAIQEANQNGKYGMPY